MKDLINDEKFLELKKQLEILGNSGDVRDYLTVQKELLSYDLSDIPASLFSGMTFYSDDAGNIDFSSTNANLDFSLVKFENVGEGLGKIIAKGCNVSNISKLTYFYDKDSFDEEVVVRKSHLFLEDKISEELRRKFIERKLTYSDIINLSDLDFQILLHDSSDLRKNDKFEHFILSFTDMHDAICLLRANNDLFVDINNIIFSNDDSSDDIVSTDNLSINIDDDPYKQREDIFALQRANVSKSIDLNNYSLAFRDKYSKIFDGSIGYSDIISLAPLFPDCNLALFSLDNGLRNLSLDVGYSHLVKFLGEYKELFDAISSDNKYYNFISNLEYSVREALTDRIIYSYFHDSSTEYTNNSNLDVDFVLRKAVMYLLPKLGMANNVFDYYEKFSMTDFSFLEVNDVSDLDKVTSNTVIINNDINNLIGVLGLENIKRFARESNAFSKEHGGLRNSFISGLDYFGKKSLNLNLNYAGFISTLSDSIMRSLYIPDYSFLEGPARDDLNQFFLPNDADDELKRLFYHRRLTLKDLKKNPSWIPYLDNVSLSFAVREFSNDRIFDQYFLKEVSNKFGNRNILNLFSSYESFFTYQDNFSVPLYFNDFESFQDDFLEEIYNSVVNNDFLDKIVDFPKEFKDKYPDILIDDSAPDELKELFYTKSITYDYLKEHPECFKFLEGKNRAVLSHSNRLKKNATNALLKDKKFNQMFFDFALIYGDKLEIILTDDEMINALNNLDMSTFTSKLNEGFAKQVLSGAAYGLEDFKFIGDKHPELFLSADAPKDLQLAFYSTQGFTINDFIINKNWVKYLKDVDFKPALVRGLLNNIYHENKKCFNKYFSLFGDETAKRLILTNPRTVRKMFIDYSLDVDDASVSNVDLMYDWYLKSGSTFLPSPVVMNEFPLAEADNFFAHCKEWSALTKNNRFNFDDNTLDALLKISYIFGVFHGDNKAFNKVLGVINGIPKKLSSEDASKIHKCISDIFECDSAIIDSDDNTLPIGYFKYHDIINAMKEEKLLSQEEIRDLEQFIFSIDFDYYISSTFEKIYGKDLKQNLRLTTNRYPKTAEAIRSFMEEIGVKSVLSGYDAHIIFGALDFKYDPDFRDFILKNYESIIGNESYCDKLRILQKHFYKYRTLVASNKYTLDSLFNSLIGKYDNVDLGNNKLSEEISINAHTYSEDDFEVLQKIYNYGKLRTYSSIPRVLGSKNGFTYEVIRLDDPLALTVGCRTGCCQELGNVGEYCMTHSVTENNGRVMVVRDKDGVVVAQSWIWRDKDLICFDDIEFVKNRAFVNKASKEYGNFENFLDSVFEVYKEAASKMVSVDEKTFKDLLDAGKISEEEYKLRASKVVVGPGYNESREVVERNLLEDTEFISGFNPVSKNRLPSEFRFRFYSDASNDRFVLEDTGRRENIKDVLDIFNYADDYVEYDSESFNNERYLIMNFSDLEHVTKGECEASEDIIAYDNPFDKLSRYYEVDSEQMRIMMNPNFALVYEVLDGEVKVCDLLFNTNISLQSRDINVDDAVSTQISNAFSQLSSKYGQVTFDTMNSKQEDMAKKSMDKIRKDEVSYGTK